VKNQTTCRFKESIAFAESMLVDSGRADQATTDNRCRTGLLRRGTGHNGVQDTLYIGMMKPVGRVFQQTFINVSANVALAKIYNRKSPGTATDMLKERVIPFFAEQDCSLGRVLTDRGLEYCGHIDRHEYERYLAVGDIVHSRTVSDDPQENELCRVFHQAVMTEFYRIAFSKWVYRSIDELQNDLDSWVEEYNAAQHRL
jgi:hypothetical protein